jgi:hypothetical protein
MKPKKPKDKFTKAPRAPTPFDLDMLMAARYAYYVKSMTIMDDRHYDDLESSYALLNGPLPVGSDRAEDYSPAQRALALYFMLSGRVCQNLSIL